MRLKKSLKFLLLFCGLIFIPLFAQTQQDQYEDQYYYATHPGLGFDYPIVRFTGEYVAQDTQAVVHYSLWPEGFSPGFVIQERKPNGEVDVYVELQPGQEQILNLQLRVIKPHDSYGVAMAGWIVHEAAEPSYENDYDPALISFSPSLLSSEEFEEGCTEAGYPRADCYPYSFEQEMTWQIRIRRPLNGENYTVYMHTGSQGTYTNFSWIKITAGSVCKEGIFDVVVNPPCNEKTEGSWLCRIDNELNPSDLEGPEGLQSVVVGEIRLTNTDDDGCAWLRPQWIGETDGRHELWVYGPDLGSERAEGRIFNVFPGEEVRFFVLFVPKENDKGLYTALLKMETSAEISNSHFFFWTRLSRCELSPNISIPSRSYEWQPAPWTFERPWRELRLSFFRGEPLDCAVGFQVVGFEIQYGGLATPYMWEWRAITIDNLDADGSPNFNDSPYWLRGEDIDLVYLIRPRHGIEIPRGRYNIRVRFLIKDFDSGETFPTSWRVFAVNYEDVKIPAPPVVAAAGNSTPLTFSFLWKNPYPDEKKVVQVNPWCPDGSCGEDDFTVLDVSASASSSASVSISSVPTSEAPLIVPPGGELEVVVEYNPPQPQSATAQIAITTEEIYPFGWDLLRHYVITDAVPVEVTIAPEDDDGDGGDGCFIRAVIKN